MSGRQTDAPIGLRRDSQGRHRVRHWFLADLRALGIAFVVTIALALASGALLEWAAGL